MELDKIRMKQHVLIENFIYTDFDKINFLKVITIGRLDNFRPFFDDSSVPGLTVRLFDEMPRLINERKLYESNLSCMISKRQKTFFQQQQKYFNFGTKNN